MNMASPERALIIELLRAILPADALITDDAGLRPYECDGLTAIREQPWVAGRS